MTANIKHRISKADKLSIEIDSRLHSEGNDRTLFYLEFSCKLTFPHQTVVQFVFFCLQCEEFQTTLLQYLFLLADAPVIFAQRVLSLTHRDQLPP